jgi:hypothetical protein
MGLFFIYNKERVARETILKWQYQTINGKPPSVYKYKKLLEKFQILIKKKETHTKVPNFHYTYI